MSSSSPHAYPFLLLSMMSFHSIPTMYSFSISVFQSNNPSLTFSAPASYPSNFTSCSWKHPTLLIMLSKSIVIFLAINSQTNDSMRYRFNFFRLKYLIDGVVYFLLHYVIKHMMLVFLILLILILVKRFKWWQPDLSERIILVLKNIKENSNIQLLCLIVQELHFHP